MFAQQMLSRIIDTDAGHASVTRTPSGHVIVFDAGRYTYADHITNQISQFSPNGQIDLLILSHTDGDHVGAVPEIMSVFNVSKVVRLGWPRCPEFVSKRQSCPWYFANKAILKSVAEKGTEDINIFELDKSMIGEVFTFGEVSLQILSAFPEPPESWGISKSNADWKNAGSIVVRVEYSDKSILFTGDTWGRNKKISYGGAEKYMVEHSNVRTLKSDVIIAPHHGADDGSSSPFLSEVSPAWVIFPAGGSYKHPRYSTYQRYINAGVKPENMFRTDLCDVPGYGEWEGYWVDGIDDSGGDDDIDITLPLSGEIKVQYVSKDEHGC